MQVTLLLPPFARMAASPILAGWVARGDRFAEAKSGREAALRECFRFSGASLPVAALTRSLDADDAPLARWLRCDPAFVMADAVTLRLMRCGDDLRVGEDEAEGFARALRPLFGDAGLGFDAACPDRWYLRCAREMELPTFSAPEDALGEDLARHLPEGEDARRWRALLNEAQIALTQHPLNAQRMRRGLPPVNSVWFWGAGVLPEQVRCEFERIVSEDAVVVALAGIAGRPSLPRSRWNQGQGETGATLIDLAGRNDVAGLDGEWFAPLEEAMRRKRLARIELRFESGERIGAKPSHRWRFWR